MQGGKRQTASHQNNHFSLFASVILRLFEHFKQTAGSIISSSICYIIWIIFRLSSRLPPLVKATPHSLSVSRSVTPHMFTTRDQIPLIRSARLLHYPIINTERDRGQSKSDPRLPSSSSAFTAQRVSRHVSVSFQSLWLAVSS